MAEQKNDDQKSPVARRGARPFAGPAAAPAAARPFLRPAAPNPRPAPFARPVVPSRTALGAPQTPKPQEAFRPPIAPPPPMIAAEAVPIGPPAPAPERPASMTPSFDISFGRWGIATPAVASPAQSEVASIVPDAAPETDTPDAWASADVTKSQFPEPIAPQAVAPEAVAPDVDVSEFMSDSVGREASASEQPVVAAQPITSEMVALDALDAFDAVWGESDRRHAVPTPTPATAAIDHASLGSGGDATQIWGEEITQAGEAPVAAADDLSVESARSTPALALPAWLADDSSAEVSALTPTPPADELPSSAPRDVVATLGGPSDEPPHSIEREPASNELRISAALDRLAARVRAGEIDVSAIAPNASDAAVLASALAALLGGSASG